MERKKLIESANNIKKVSRESLEEYKNKKDILVSRLNEIMLKREDIIELIGGSKNIEMMKDNHNNHVRFIISILEKPNGEILVDTVIWVFRAYMSRGFIPNYWAAQINTWIYVLKENLSENSFNEIYEIYNWLSINIPQFTYIAEKTIREIQ